MKISLSIFLTLAIVIQTFNSLFIVIGYEINKDYITQNYCENKNNPWKHCCGKCHMMKQIKEQERKEQGLPPVRDKQEVIYFLQPYPEIQAPVDVSTEKNFIFCKEISSQIYSACIFHPPIA